MIKVSVPSIYKILPSEIASLRLTLRNLFIATCAIFHCGIPTLGLSQKLENPFLKNEAKPLPPPTGIFLNI